MVAATASSVNNLTVHCILFFGFASAASTSRRTEPDESGPRAAVVGVPSRH